MLNVLVIITTAMEPHGGLASVMMNLYRVIDKQKIHIDFASTNAVLDKKLEYELSMNGTNYFALGNRKREMLKYIRNLSEVIKAGNYDVVHINSNSATAAIELIIAKQYGVNKRIVHNHTSNCDHKILHQLCYPLFKTAYTDAIACSEKAGEWLFKDGKYRILNNGIDTNRYMYSQESRKTIRKQFNIAETTFVIGHVGKIYKPKNHPFLIEIFANYHSKNPDSKLLLVGDGVMRQEMEEKVTNLGLRNEVIFAGMQNQPEKFLSAMDVFVFPSLWEGMPLSVIEAQANGLKCYVSDRIDNSVCLTDEVSFLPVELNADRWAHNLLECVANSDRSNESLDAIRKIRAKGFDAYDNAIELESVYQT